jgi:hypothetical protein
MLFIPQTVAHVFADILDNLKLNKNRKILLGTVQTISQDAFMSDSLDLELGNFDAEILADLCLINFDWLKFI